LFSNIIQHIVFILFVPFLFEYLLVSQSFSLNISGTGLTQKLQLVRVSDKVVLGDTPGLDDIAAKKQAAAEIEAALKRNGRYRLVFVVTLESGRCRSADAATVKRVLESVSVDVPFAVIINKLAPEELADLEANADLVKRVTMGILNAAGNKSTRHFLFLKLDSSLHGKNDTLPSDEMRKKIDKFLSGVPFVTVKPENVQEINTEDFEELQERMAKEIDRLEKDQKFREQEWEKRLQAETAKYEREMKDFEAKRKADMDTLEAKRKQQEELYTKQMQEYQANAEKMKALHEQQAQNMKFLQDQVVALQNRPPPAPIVVPSGGGGGFCTLM
jgi:hypothetical protein